MVGDAFLDDYDEKKDWHFANSEMHLPFLSLSN